MGWIPSVDFALASVSARDASDEDAEAAANAPVTVIEGVEMNLSSTDVLSDAALAALQENVDCRGGEDGAWDWADYDETNDRSISVMGFEWRIERG